MAESTHRVEIVPVNLEPHPDADTLSIVRVFDGYTVCVRTADWQGITLGAYVPPDSVMPDRPEYAYLDGNLRIKARKLRGVMSMGLLVPAPEGSQVGDDVAEALGIKHYVPKMSVSKMGCQTRAVQVPPPPGCEHIPKYDVETFYKYGRRAFEAGEHVWVTEKIHGANARYIYADGRICVGSRTRWVKRDDDKPCIWWKALLECPELEAFLVSNPGVTVFGEVYGYVQDLRYGHGPGEVSFAAFDVMGRDTKYLSWRKASDMLSEAAVPQVPLVHSGPFDFDHALSLADGLSRIPGANHIREGVVIKPDAERWDHRFGRTALKIVSNLYLARAK